jgi:hypothetical protein
MVLFDAIITSRYIDINLGSPMDILSAIDTSISVAKQLYELIDDFREAPEMPERISSTANSATSDSTCFEPS